MADGGGSAQQERILCQNFVDLRRYRRSSMAKSLVATSTKSESNLEEGLPRIVLQQPTFCLLARNLLLHLLIWRQKCQELSHAQISYWWRHRWGRPRTVRCIAASSPLSFFVAVGANFFSPPPSCTRALDRLRTRRCVGSARRRGNDMHDHSRFQRDIDDVTGVSLSLCLSQKSLTHNIGSASALPIIGSASALPIIRLKTRSFVQTTRSLTCHSHFAKIIKRPHQHVAVLVTRSLLVWVSPHPERPVLWSSLYPRHQEDICLDVLSYKVMHI